MIFYADSKRGVRFWLTDRFGGVSSGAFGSLNLGVNTGDSSVAQNMEILKNHLKIPKLFYLNQIHSDTIIDFSGNAAECLGSGDGVLCETPKSHIMISVADCHPVLLVAKNQFAILHAGRAGLEKRIITKALKMLDSSEIYAFIGAGIKECCYEISGDLLESYRRDNAAYVREKGGIYTLDMLEMIIDELRDFEIPHLEIKWLPICSRCDERFYSYRRDKSCGRFALIATIA